MCRSSFLSLEIHTLVLLRGPRWMLCWRKCLTQLLMFSASVVLSETISDQVWGDRGQALVEDSEYAVHCLSRPNT